MMMYLLMCVATVAIVSAIPRMEFGRLMCGVSSGSHYDGGNMTISCTDQPTSVGALNSLSLLRLRGLEVTETVVFKMYFESDIPFPRERWGRNDTRYSVDQHSLATTGAEFRITIQNLNCNDDCAQYWCLAEGSGTHLESHRKNLSLAAIPRMKFGRLIGGGSSCSYYDGGNMTITCTDQPSSVGSLTSLSLLRLRGLEVTETVVFKIYVESDIPFPQERWGRNDPRYSVDQHSLVTTGAKFRIIIQNLNCNDDCAQYWCLANGSDTGSGPRSMESPRQNLSIAGLLGSTTGVNAGATSPSTTQHRTTIAVNAGAATSSHLVVFCPFMSAILTLTRK